MERYRVRDLERLRTAMRASKRTVPHSVRSLADVVGKSHTQVGYLLTGQRPVVDEETARKVAAALSCTVDDLFLPEASQSRDRDGVSPE